MKHVYFVCAILLGRALVSGAEPPWSEILGPSQGTIPPTASFEVVWRGDLQAALAEAKEKQLPLFVTLRCLPSEGGT